MPVIKATFHRKLNKIAAPMAMPRKKIPRWVSSTSSGEKASTTL